MANFKTLTGATLKNRINGFAKKAATFSADLHQLAYSAINHVELHNDPVYVNALLNNLPLNYRRSVVVWAKHFGKVSFDSKESVFTYSKKAESDLPGAMAVSPAEFVKESNRGKMAFDEVKRLESMIKAFTENKAQTKVIKALEGVLRLAKGEELIANSVVNSQELIKARKVRKARKAKTASATAKKAA